MTSDRLYLNKGNFKFQDITTSSNIYNESWSTAVSIADVNNDGYMDIYVGKYMLKPEAARANHLYINNGDLSFTESAKQYGIADVGHTTAANFFDYNKDGFLDLYVGNQPFVDRHTKSVIKQVDNQDPYTDRLYRNLGNGKFQEVTKEAGVFSFNYTLSATVSDLDNDGWPDIYVACDYEEPDLFYHNNGNGTFTNVANTHLRHMSNFSMGVDIADFNNDGWHDIHVADMVAADNYRLKANMGGMNPEKFWNLAKSGYHYQYMFNMLQLNNGNNSFSDIAQLAGVANTDWSWATLFGDYDNDGYKDLYVTNGLVKDIKNKDYTIERSKRLDSLANVARSRGEKPQINSMELVKLAPSKKISNYLFKNNGDLTFAEKMKEWGTETPTFSHGAAYVDLDNDGDLDMVVNNMNDPAFIYENTSVDKGKVNYLRVALKGDHGNNRLSYGARVNIYYGEEEQLQEVAPVRGYFSSVEPTLHFGLGDVSTIDRVVVKWLDGRELELKDVSTNQTLVLSQSEAKVNAQTVAITEPTMFRSLTNSGLVDFVHRENIFDDYEREILLPHKMSNLGPTLAEADVNGDGLTDFFIGGAVGNSGTLFQQLSDGKFAPFSNQPWEKDAKCEDLSALFFDADGDNDLDLYVASGGNEYDEGNSALQDRLYLNDGKGNYTKASNAIPADKVSTGTAKAGDFDGDGDLDLFVGGRQVPGKYGFIPRSFIYENQNGVFKDVTSTVAPELQNPGMVTDALWHDFDKDGDTDLVICGEWMPIMVMTNEGKKLSNTTENAGTQLSHGWWNHLELADLDGDGDDDIVAGNLGLNIKYKATQDEPFTVNVKDFDGNGTHDVYLGYYDTDGVCYPVRGRQCSSQQMPFIKKKFKSYDAFAKASYDEVIGDKIDGAVGHKAYTFETSWFENRGQLKFEQRALPTFAQFSTVHDFICRDWNNDGNMDILFAGNYYEREVETTRSDASIGGVLLGDGKGGFSPLHSSKSGFFAFADARALALIEDGPNKPIVIIGNNNAKMQIYQLVQ